VLAFAAVASGASAQQFDYKASLEGVADSDLAGRIEAASSLISLAEQPPAGLAGLRRRADDDKGRIDEVLRSEGYYQGRVAVNIDQSVSPAQVHIQVDPGRASRLVAFTIHFVAPGPLPPELKTLGVELDQRARAEPVVKAEAALLKDLGERAYPLAKVVERRVVVDDAAATMRVELDVDPGPKARFGPVTVTGLTGLDEAWVRNRIPWQHGDPFSLKMMERLRKRLTDSRLFAAVHLTPATELDADGLLPVTVALTEGKSRSVGIGGSWGSSEGFSGQAFWEDRNLLGGAEKLRGQATDGKLRKAVDFSYDGPDVGMPDQNLIGATKVERQTTEAYTSNSVGGSAGLAWQLGETWHASASAAYERTLETQDTINYNVSLASMPLELRHDGSDSLLDPTAGDRVTLTVQPFLSLLGDHTAFIRMELYGTEYLKLLDSPRLVLAGWERVGTIQGAGEFAVPPDKRFYVGGSGSLRAYAFQKAGPLDVNDTPLGGNSSLSFGGEIRIKATDEIGVVPFVEGGRAYSGAIPDLGQSLFWGAGLGLRYYTALGPVRADIGIPLTPRSNIDGHYQVTLSLGQAF